MSVDIKRTKSKVFSLKLFITEAQRKELHSTCFHQFYKGKWDEKTFWKDDSICLDDDYLSKGFAEAVREIVPEYNPYGVTEISVEKWRKIGETIKTKDAHSRLIYEEADYWLKTVFSEYDCFTILGI